ncbi:hypothetical protein FGG08_006952 [Glutinoglossum americanum]|uniref:Asl1-like glycosyl hydrolase catalytic domain-containing protein n=1 Tax=Glutinoglossum americanum TaxID=1670608 RepID=A0A9P8L1E6_9PEZI|nr:hypothetical protein FGG08_006952 [Glutinoglossum americanum]
MLVALLLLPTVLATSSPKRGLIHIPSPAHPADDAIWLSPPTDLTWYYNYAAAPSPALPALHFVPQLWGAPSSDSDTAFLDAVRALLAAGTNVSHVLAFNEPDGAAGSGGSDVDPARAARAWNREIAPLRELGVRLGAPAVTGAPAGMAWLRAFFEACGCEADFVPVHWYGSFEGLASRVGEVRAAWPRAEIWVTDYITRYSYFGSFRSDVSNVGPNAAMLTQDGELTDIGSWYLGRGATGNVPKGGKKKSGAVARGAAGWAAWVVAGVVVVALVVV